MFNKNSVLAWARRLKRNILAVWIASRDSRTPLTAKLLAALVAGYALSPIDLIPDFIPVLGYLDDLIIVPVGIAVVIRLIPETLMAEFNHESEQLSKKPISFTAATMVVLTWIAITVSILLTLYFN